jgi:hypothetical protein
MNSDGIGNDEQTHLPIDAPLSPEDRRMRAMLDDIRGEIRRALASRPKLQSVVLLPFEPITIMPRDFKSDLGSTRENYPQRMEQEIEKGRYRQFMRTQRPLMFDGLVMEISGDEKDIATIGVSDLHAGAVPCFGCAGTIPIAFFKRIIAGSKLQIAVSPGIDVYIGFESDVRSPVQIRTVGYGGSLSL